MFPLQFLHLQSNHLRPRSRASNAPLEWSIQPYKIAIRYLCIFSAPARNFPTILSFFTSQLQFFLRAPTSALTIDHYPPHWNVWAPFPLRVISPHCPRSGATLQSTHQKSKTSLKPLGKSEGGYTAGAGPTLQHRWEARLLSQGGSTGSVRRAVRFSCYGDSVSLMTLQTVSSFSPLILVKTSVARPALSKLPFRQQPSTARCLDGSGLCMVESMLNIGVCCLPDKPRRGHTQRKAIMEPRATLHHCSPIREFGRSRPCSTGRLTSTSELE